MRPDTPNLAVIPPADEIRAGALLADYVEMCDLLGELPFDDFACGHEAMDAWFAVRPVPVSLPRAS